MADKKNIDNEVIIGFSENENKIKLYNNAT